jgi:SnoaL-like domain
MTDPKVQELIDRASVTDLYAKYALGIDQGDRALFASVWASEAQLTYDAVDMHLVGRDAIMRWYDERPGASPVLPAVGGNLRLAGNHLIRIDGDRATGKAEIVALRYTGTSMHLYSAGVYDDEFERRDGEWLIVRRDMVLTPILPP